MKHQKHIVHISAMIQITTQNFMLIVHKAEYILFKLDIFLDHHLTHMFAI